MTGSVRARLELVPAWVRVGLPTGVIASGVTLLANLSVLIFQPSQLCRVGPLLTPLSMLAALGAFLVLAAVAGFITGRITGAVVDAALAGLVVGAVSGVALVAMIPFFPAMSHRLGELTARCPDTDYFMSGGSFTFNIGPTPPPVFEAPTFPPGVIPTAAPGFFPAPPAMAPSMPSGPAGVALFAFGLLFNAGVGMGFASGAAALGGLIGAATRPAPA